MRTPTFFASIVLAGSLLAACEEDGEDPLAESCQAIIDVCHDVDPGAGRITECHETAHDDGTAAACDPIEAECVALCEAAAATDAGHAEHDSGHAGHDGGH